MTTLHEILCACGSKPSAEWLDILESMPSLKPQCDECERKSIVEDRKAQQWARDAENRQRIAQRLTNIPPEIRATETGDPRFNSRLWEAIKDWSPTNPRWLGIIGPPGACKTRCLGLIARKFIEAGNNVVWSSAVEFQRCVEDQMSKRPHISEPARDRLREIRTAEILVYDDFFKSSFNQHLERHVYDLIDYRKSHYLHVLWSSNSSIPDMLASNLLTHERAGAILGRLAESSRQVVIK